MITPAPQAYHNDSSKTPAELLSTVRELISESPLAGLEPETIAERLDIPPWSVELVVEALRLEDGEVAP